MGKTTNILDLNNRLEKVEKENVAQNSYTSLKNKPKINSVTLSGNKSLADIGAAAAADLNNLKYHKIVESASTGTYAQKLQSLATAYNALTNEQKMTALLIIADYDICQPINCAGYWCQIWMDPNGIYPARYGLDGYAYYESLGTVTDISNTEDTKVFAIWICE